MLTQFDDFPRHQVVETLASVGPTDVSFSDGYYFCFWDAAGRTSIAMGLRIYPNVDVVDGYAACMQDGQVKVIRCSRRWSNAYDDLRVGPISLEIVQGLSQRRLRVDLTDLFGGLEMDLLWRATNVPYQESRRTERLHGRVVRDLIRYWQVGRPSGRVRLGSETFHVDEKGWYCIMDHSWGLRQSVGPGYSKADFPPEPRLTADRNGLLRLVVAAQMPSRSIFVQSHEDASGRVLGVEGRVDWFDGRSNGVAELDHELTYEAGTRKLVSARCTVKEEPGDTWSMSLRPTHTGTVTSALGYQFETKGFADNRGMGVYRGDQWLEHDIWRHDGVDVVAPDGRRFPYNGYIGPASVVANDEAGMAYLETVVLGAYGRYGFDAPELLPVTLLPIA
jgi:hypothetical protein